MITFLISSVALLLLNSSVAFAEVNHVIQKNQNMKNSALSDEALTEELTGRKESLQISSSDLKKSPLPVQHFIAGQKAAASKNYILAIKHFNTVIQNYPQSNQVRPALLAKASVYKEMGLQPQAERNFKLAQVKTKTRASQVAGRRVQNKITK